MEFSYLDENNIFNNDNDWNIIINHINSNIDNNQIDIFVNIINQMMFVYF